LGVRQAMTGAKLLPRTISALMGSGGKLTAIISVEGRSHADKPTYSGAFNGCITLAVRPDQRGVHPIGNAKSAGSAHNRACSE